MLEWFAKAEHNYIGNIIIKKKKNPSLLEEEFVEHFMFP